MTRKLRKVCNGSAVDGDVGIYGPLVGLIIIDGAATGASSLMISSRGFDRDRELKRKTFNFTTHRKDFDMTIATLDQVRDKLYLLFNEAAEQHEKYEDPARGSGLNCHALENHAVQNRIALGTLAQAIAAVEQEQREQRQAFPAKPAIKAELRGYPLGRNRNRDR